MKKNVGSIDRGLRIVAGLSVGGLGIYFQSWWGLIGIIPITTGLLSWCPAYLPFGIKTCRTEPKQDEQTS